MPVSISAFCHLGKAIGKEAGAGTQGEFLWGIIIPKL